MKRTRPKYEERDLKALRNLAGLNAEQQTFAAQIVKRGLEGAQNIDWELTFRTQKKIEDEKRLNTRRILDEALDIASRCTTPEEFAEAQEWLTLPPVGPPKVSYSYHYTGWSDYQDFYCSPNKTGEKKERKEPKRDACQRGHIFTEESTIQHEKYRECRICKTARLRDQPTCKRGHIRTDETTIYVKKEWSDTPSRVCRVCQEERLKARYIPKSSESRKESVDAVQPLVKKAAC